MSPPGELDPDHDPATVTVRNSDLSPLGGQTTTPAEKGILAAQVGMVTLIASDGSSYSQKDLMIYTDNGGPCDRLSGCGNTCGGGLPLEGFAFVSLGGSVTPSTMAGQLCMETSLLGDNMAMWVGRTGDMPLSMNSVYDIALQMTSSNVAPGHTPFWDVFLDNNNDLGTGLNLYGADGYFLDNEGGANAAISSGKTFHMVWAPLAVGLAQWNDPATGPFRTAVGDAIKGRFVFRVMDVWLNGNSGIRADIQSGTICLKNLTITKYPLSGVKTVGAALYDVSTFTDSTASGTGNLVTTTLTPGATVVTTTGGGITIAPSANGQATMYTSFFPGDTNNDYNNPVTQADNFPAVNMANTIYRMSYTIAAVDANSAANPPDCFYIGVDTPSNEVICQSFVTSNLGGCAMPKTTPSTYVAFYHSNYGTNSTVGMPWKRLRPYFIVANLPSLGGAANNNSGAIKITNLKVEKVTFDGWMAQSRTRSCF